MENKNITVSATITAPIENVWNYWTLPEHITQWYFASDDWHAPHAENDFQVGGKFTTRMEAKDGSFGFDFNGIYDEIETKELISYTMEDGRKQVFSFQKMETKLLSPKRLKQKMKIQSICSAQAGKLF
jgi:uncharacterized protein YndB with AHSA1/START domain